jgi:hypothetical protein
MLRGTGTLTFPENRLSPQPTQQPLHSNVYLIGKEMFISAESASKRIQLQQASPAITTWRRLNPNRNGDYASGMRVLASSCGDTHVDLTPLGLKWALTLKWNAFPSKSSKAKVRKRTKININFLHDHGVHVRA